MSLVDEKTKILCHKAAGANTVKKKYMRDNRAFQ